MRPVTLALTLMLATLLLTTTAAADTVDIGRFDGQSSLSERGWELVRFDEKIPATQYRLLQWQGVEAVEARAAGSMALLAKAVEVDLLQTPVLCWRWWIDAPLESADMQTRQGDDYAARVYVAFRLPREALGLGTRARLALGRRIYGSQVPDAAINYVWDNRYAVGTQRANAYTDRAWMVVQRSGADLAGHWVEERRDVRADLQAAFGTGGELTLIAVAADTDNTGEQARALFAELHFVAREGACRFASPPGP
jgi:hypothetical protein